MIGYEILFLSFIKNKFIAYKKIITSKLKYVNMRFFY